jgi:hypothetical protein
LYAEKFFHRLHSQFKCLYHDSFAFYFVKLPLLKDYPPLSSYNLNKNERSANLWNSTGRNWLPERARHLKWYRQVLGFDVPIFDEKAEARS